MPELVVYERRRAGGDRPGVVRVRRREGGDVSLSRRAPSTPVSPAGEDMVTAFLSRRPFYISHRMGGTEFPEFTQTGLNASLRAGFKALELSVRRCASGEFVAIHDWKTTRTVPGTDYQIWNTPWSTLRTLRQASGGFMRLTDIVDQVPDDIVLAIDHKRRRSWSIWTRRSGGIPSAASCGRSSRVERARRARRHARTGPWPCCTQARLQPRTCPSGT